MAHFSFNKPDGACPTCTGLGVLMQPNLEALVDTELSVAGGAVRGWDKFRMNYYTKILVQAGKHYGVALDLTRPVKEFGAVQRDLLLYGVASPQFKRHFPKVKPPTTVSRGKFEGVATSLLRRYTEHVQDPAYREKMSTLLSEQACPECKGTRLSLAARQVTVTGRSIMDVARLSLTEIGVWLERLKELVSEEEWLIAEPIVNDLRERVRRLVDVGAGYLTLERNSPTLSAGEAVISSFHVTNGLRPYVALALGPSDVLYGLTTYGGLTNLAFGMGQGTLFKLTESREITTLVYFDRTNGAEPPQYAYLRWSRCSRPRN